MTGTTNASTKTAVIATPAERAVVVALRKLPPLYVSEVLRYIEFLDYKINVTSDELAGDAALWAAVKVNQEYKRLHPDEALEVYETGADFLEAVNDL